MKIFHVILAALLFSLITGCAATGSVTDLNNVKTNINQMTVSSGKLHISTSGTTRLIDLNKVVTVQMEPKFVTSIDREFYCRATVSFLDGTVIGTLRDNDPRDNWVWIRAGDNISGNSSGGTMSVPIVSLSRIDINHR